MPKQTFLNLPTGRKARLVDCAIDEFSGRSFNEASLSRIVVHAKIAKGSVYQYFEDKLDLYEWLICEELPRRKVAAMQADFERAPPADLRSFLTQAVLAGLSFFRDNPKLAQLALQVSAPVSDPKLAALYRQMRQQGHTSFTAMLRSFADQLDPDLDLELVAAMLGSVLTDGLRSVLERRLGVDLLDLITDAKSADALQHEQLEPVVADVVCMVLRGCAKRPMP